MIFCLTMEDVVLYIFVKFSVNVLYIIFTSSLFSILFQLAVDVFSYFEDGQMIAHIIYYQATLYIHIIVCCEYCLS